MTRPARLGWALFATTCVCLAAYVALEAYPDGHLFTVASVAAGFPVIPLGVLLSGLLGALVVAGQPRHPVGWLLAVAATGGAVGFATGAYAYRALTTPGFGPAAAGHWSGWVSQFFGAAYALGFTCALFLLVPDGRLPSRRWWPVMALLVASYLLWAGVLVIGVRPRQVHPDQVHAGPLADGLLSLSSLMLIVAIMAAAAAMVVRLRRSSGVRRQQMRWLAASGALLAAGVVLLIGYQSFVGPGEPWYVSLPLFLGYTSVPVFAGIAVLKYRLYDIDVIISRAVVLATLTAFVTIGYVAVVVAIGAVLGGGVAGRFWPSLVALVMVALAFQPLRQRVVRLADRLVYGRRAAPYEALAEFSRRLGRAGVAADLLPALAEAVARSVGAVHARVTLPGSGASAAWPDEADRRTDEADRTPDVELDVRDGEELLGRIAVAMPAGRGLRPAERRLLADFAAQAGLALRNRRLDADLGARVAQLARQSAELAASRRRLLAAQDAERRRTAGVIEREVLSHLRPIPAAVEALGTADPAAADQILERLEAATADGLDALREITRGLFPVLLTRRGLAPALRSHVDRLGRPGLLDVSPAVADRRFDARTETAAYFCGVALVAQLDAVRLAVTEDDGALVVEAVGGAAEPDVTAIVDRVEAAGGLLTTGHEPDGRCRVRAAFPVPADQPPVPADQSPVSVDQPPTADAQTAASRSVPNADLAT